MRDIIVGIGNPILCDDGVGLHIARALKDIFPDADVHTTSVIDLQLLEIISDHDRIFIVDALVSNSDNLGTVKKLNPDQETLHLFSSHGLHFFELVKLGRELQYKLPEIAGIYGIVIGDECPFGTVLSPEILMKENDIICEISQDIMKNGLENCYIKKINILKG